MPLVGGELARAAFEHGFEPYGVETILKYANMIYEKEETYLWYFPNGKAASLETSTSPDAQPTDGWGSSAMVYAFMEGLVGIVDEGFLFNRIKLSPRWAATKVTRATAQVGYGASDAGFKYEFELQPGENKILLKLAGTTKLSLHVLLPPGTKAEKLLCSGKSIPFQNVKVENSNYVDAELTLAGEENVAIILTWG